MNPQNYVMPHDDLLFKINLKLERWSQTVLNNFFPRFLLLPSKRSRRLDNKAYT